MKTLLATGMQRSGTTLVDKLLNAHPDLSVLSQPFPFLFVEVKRAFLRDHLGEDDEYPLGPLFGEERYDNTDLTGFLRHFQLGPDLVRRLFADMVGFSGQLTDFPDESLEHALAGFTGADLAGTMERLLTRLSPRPDAAVHGSKEILCEEFLPFLLESGSHGVIVVRDPRDVIASLNHGRGREHTGRLKPTLFNLRHWRKSVAFALHLRDHPRFSLVGYEALTADPVAALAPVAEGLGLRPFAPDMFTGELTDSSGRPWHGNSSHQQLHGVATDSVERWRTTLSEDTARFVEAACYPEMLALGLPVSLHRSDVERVLGEYDDPYPLERPELADHAGPDARAAECARLALLDGPATDEARAAFVFEDVRERLRAAVAAPAPGVGR